MDSGMCRPERCGPGHAPDKLLELKGLQSFGVLDQPLLLLPVCDCVHHHKPPCRPIPVSAMVNAPAGAYVLKAGLSAGHVACIALHEGPRAQRSRHNRHAGSCRGTRLDCCCLGLPDGQAAANQPTQAPDEHHL